MFDLNEILQNAQDGKAIENLAQQFGITPEQAQSAVHALIPAISTALLKKAGEPGALGSIISAITDASHKAAFASAGAAQSPETVQKANAIIAQIFGSSHIVQQIAQRASSLSGLRPDVIANMLPVVMSIALGGLGKSLENQGLGGALGELASAVQQGKLGSMLGTGGGLMGILASLFGSLFGAPQAGGTSAKPAIGALVKMFESGNLPAEISKSGLSQEVGKILSASKS